MVGVTAMFAYVIFQPEVNILEFFTAVSAFTRKGGPVNLLGASRILEMQSFQMVLVSIATREHACGVAVDGLVSERF